MRIAFLVEYDGTAYAGWQLQKNDVTVQQKIEEALLPLGKGRIPVFGAGRTDAGVHARGQCGHFDLETNIPAEKFAFILNTHLPPDIRVTKSWQAEEGFHCRFSAKGKRYVYRVWNAPHASALMGRFTTHVPEKLDVAAMEQAARVLVGTHDFAAFCAAGGSAKTTVRTVSRLEIAEKDGLITFTVEGNGFLYNMVRILVGTLIEVGKGKKTPQDVETILSGGVRKYAGMTAEAKGLTLDEVFY
ncbi:MAG: tRNA pseudouridine(38-40) synthase TruA [Clostridia bacterium]|nr:tRNA pseudouridine(38-40) synthase TruA [Clostridia bacterium]